MRQAFADVIKFESACGHTLSQSPPRIPDERTLLLRLRLLNEEFDEVTSALVDADLSKIADGLADLIFVAVGTAIRFGIDLPAVWDAVAEANLKKFGPGFYRDNFTGKVLKPPGWMHPDIGAILGSQSPIGLSYPAGDVRNGPSFAQDGTPDVGLMTDRVEPGIALN